MTTTTTVRPLPSQYQEVVEQCDEMDWDVEKSPSSVKVIPPKGSKVKPFSMPRNNPWAPPQLGKNLKENGFLGAYEAFKQGRGEGVKAEDKPDKEVRVCEFCKEDPDVKEPFSTTHPPAMGVHQRHKHGILGKSAEAIRKRSVTAAKKASSRKPPAAKAPAAKASAPSERVMVPAQRTASSPSKTEPLVNLSGLPISVATHLSDLIVAISATSGDAEDLQKEVDKLRDFRNQVEAEANDGNKAPVQIVASILALVQKTKQN